MKRLALQNKQVEALRMAFRARKVFGTFEKRASGIVTEIFRDCAQWYLLGIAFTLSFSL